jgi:hypothetical protein
MRLPIVLLLLLSGCTMGLPMQNFDEALYKDCQSVECVMDAIDQAPESMKECKEPLWMEGYKMWPLRDLYAEGHLELVEWHPLVSIPAALGFWPHGAVRIYKGTYGDLYKAIVYYTKDPENHVLAHELMHVAGPCPDVGPFGLGGSFWDYAKEQKKIMEEEGVSSWTQTKYYREHND